jgi:hypothetical protein
VDRERRERHAVVGANRERQPVLAEHPFEDRPRRRRLGREQAMALEQEARVLVGDRERKAVDAVPSAELSLEVGRPQVVRRRRRDRHDARMLPLTTSSPVSHEPAAREQVSRRARRRPVLDLGMPAAQDVEQLPRAPVRVQPAELAQQLCQHGADLRRAGVRAPAAVDQPALAVLVEAGEPLVADAPAHPVALAELGHREPIAQRVGHELQSLIHGVTLRPRHRSLPCRSPAMQVSRVLPMSLDYSVTYVPGLYLAAA